MNDKLNDQFPPISPNGNGAAHREKHNRKKNQSPADEDTLQAERPKPKRPVDHVGQRTSNRHDNNAPQLEVTNPAQIASARISRYVAKHPIQTIGGLLALLLVVVLFKAFYQGKNWKAKRLAEEAYYVANQYARNNGTNLHPYLSRAFRQQVSHLPGLLPLSMQTATRGGTITGAESVGLREVAPDSVVVELSVVFENGTEEKRYQPLVYQKDQWRLGLSYSE